MTRTALRLGQDRVDKESERRGNGGFGGKAWRKKVDGVGVKMVCLFVKMVEVSGIGVKVETSRPKASNGQQYPCPAYQ